MIKSIITLAQLEYISHEFNIIDSNFIAKLHLQIVKYDSGISNRIGDRDQVEKRLC